MNPGFHQFKKKITNPLTFKLFMLQHLPSALFAGLRIASFNEQQAVVTVNYTWFNQNPFKSMYFAIQSMAAEMSTGLLASAQVFQRKPAVSMLVIGLEAKFVKKAIGTISFSSSDGQLIAEAIDITLLSGECQIVKCYSVGTNESGEMVAEFWITWSFKAKKL